MRVLRWWSVSAAGLRLTGRTALLPGLALPELALPELALPELALPELALPGSVAAPQQMVGHDQPHEEAGYHSDDHQSDDCQKFAHRLPRE